MKQKATILITLIASVLLTSGCTATSHAIAPYENNKEEAERITAIASAYCINKRGANNQPPNQFTTDGCSMWPDEIGNDSWSKCCIQHDIAYWCGGTEKDREEADRRLQECVTGETTAFWGDVMYLGVQLGGAPWGIMHWRWGYGWDWPRNYDEEQEEEKEPAKAGRNH